MRGTAALAAAAVGKRSPAAVILRVLGLSNCGRDRRRFYRVSSGHRTGSCGGEPVEITEIEKNGCGTKVKIHCDAFNLQT